MDDPTLATLTIASRPGGVSCMWLARGGEAFSETVLLTTMRDWCGRLTLDGEVGALELNLHRLISEGGGPDTIGFGFARAEDVRSHEVLRPASELLAAARAYLSECDG